MLDFLDDMYKFLIIVNTTKQKGKKKTVKKEKK